MTCATVRMEAETYETVDSSRRIASTSSSESFELAPKPARAPEDVTLPGSTIRKFVPRDFSWFSACIRAPSPMPTTATTQATPMMMPRAVRSERSLLRERARKATLRMFPVLVTANIRPPRGSDARGAAGLTGRSGPRAHSRPAGQRLVQDLHRLVHLAGAHDERRRDADDVAVESPLSDQEAAFLRLFEQAHRLLRRGRPVLNGLVGHELEALHEAHSPHVAESLRIFLLEAVEAGAQARARLGGAFRRVHLLHDLDRG